MAGANRVSLECLAPIATLRLLQPVIVELATNESAVPSRAVPSSAPRLLYIDVCRGLLFLLMTSSHALTLLNVTSDHWLRTHGLPQRWAPVGFVSLTGFAIGTIFFPKPDTVRTRSRLFQRGWRILVVMFVSNLLLLIASNALSGEIDIIRQPSWWIGLVTLQTPYSISSILIPTAGVLFIAPSVLKALRTHSHYLVLAVCVLASCAIAAFARQISSPESLHYLLRPLLFRANGFFPFLPLLGMGATSIALGTIWNRRPFEVAVVTVSGFILMSSLQGVSPIVSTLHHALSGPCRLVVLLVIAVAVLQLPCLKKLCMPLALIGQYALWSFLLHRVILHVLVFGTADLGVPWGQAGDYFVMVGGTMFCIWISCLSRTTCPRWDTFLKSIYL